VLVVASSYQRGTHENVRFFTELQQGALGADELLLFFSPLAAGA
jgi:hypothetical protein